MEWTKEQLEELIQKMYEKSVTDAEFRKALLEDSTKALTELAGRELPADCNFQIIERDPMYNATFVLPDMISEELSPEQMDDASGAGSIFIGFSACAIAIGTLSCPGDACGARLCVGNHGCGGQACAGNFDTL